MIWLQTICFTVFKWAIRFNRTIRVGTVKQWLFFFLMFLLSKMLTQRTEKKNIWPTNQPTISFMLSLVSLSSSCSKMNKLNWFRLTRSPQLRRLAYCKILFILQALEVMNSPHQLNRYNKVDTFSAKKGYICIKRAMSMVIKYCLYYKH